jgi:hypothetical protein
MTERIKQVIAARLVLERDRLGEVPYSLPLPPNKPLPREHIDAAVKIVANATETERKASTIEINRIVYNVDEYGQRIY